MMTTKPQWKDAPQWANWLSQDHDGKWFWSAGKVAASKRDGFFSPVGFADYRCKLAGRGEVNHQWKQTLEQRPEAE
ncbi:hypothetical protein [Endozoicomonas acroporae]|uniref:hypothetical protein n=1 Tax=Endozoicomonas acroporae TaxID=1701104 RepID=UPI003D79B115